MATERHCLHLSDELPDIGSGRRFVTAEVGRKWVYVKPSAAIYADQHRSKIKRELWDKLVAQTEALIARCAQPFVPFNKRKHI